MSKTKQIILIFTLFLIGNSVKLHNHHASCTSRDTIMQKAQSWVSKNVPYSQQGSYDGYRTDCSGFVSMCWGLSKPGLTTYTLPNVSIRIKKEDLQNGDAIVCPSNHVVLFAGWTDNSKSSYTSM